jgi:alpha-L-fucosidase
MKLPANSPSAYGALPSRAQVAWHEMESYAFLHFGLNTFTGKEWGYGDESEKLFNPVDFDAGKIVRDFKSAGFKGVVIVAKHHDGFCLWPSKFTEHSVKNSPWKNGKGDVLRELSDACRQADMKFGVYLSPWDRNHAEYGRPAYVEYYHAQLREVLSSYGDIFMVWMDGANGGDGFYGGAREKRSIDASTYYDVPRVVRTVRELQPGAVIFSDAGPDVRWIGNEAGQTPATSWHTIDGAGLYAGKSGINELLSHGTRGGSSWRPAEVDVSIRPGWFYHADEDARVKTPRQLVDIYFNAVGRGADLHLNFPPDPRGTIGQRNIANAREMRRILDATFQKNLAAGAKITASATRKGAFGAPQVLDARRDTFWAAPDGTRSAELVFELPRPATFDVVRLQEVIELGQRLDGFGLDIWEDGAWRQVLEAQSVGFQRLDRLEKPVTTARVRLRLSAPVAPVLASFGLHLQPATLEAPQISRAQDGLLSVSGQNIRYTLDGSEPTLRSPLFAAPIPLLLGGTVRARAFDNAGHGGEVATATFGISKAQWKVIEASNEAGAAHNAIDENPSTLWHTHAGSGEAPPPQSLAVDMGQVLEVRAFTYLPRQDGTTRGLVTHGKFEVSVDGTQWREAWHGEFSNVAANPILQTVALAAPQRARYFRFTAEKAAQANHVAVAELGVVVR